MQKELSKWIDERPDKRILRAVLDFLILKRIEEKPSHGYELTTYFRKKYGIYFGPSTVYPLLEQLETRRFVESSWQLNNERPRKVYRITPKGCARIRDNEKQMEALCKLDSSIEVAVRVLKG